MFISKIFSRINQLLVITGLVVVSGEVCTSIIAVHERCPFKTPCLYEPHKHAGNIPSQTCLLSKIENWSEARRRVFDVADAGRCEGEGSGCAGREGVGWGARGIHSRTARCVLYVYVCFIDSDRGARPSQKEMRENLPEEIPQVKDTFRMVREKKSLKITENSVKKSVSSGKITRSDFRQYKMSCREVGGGWEKEVN